MGVVVEAENVAELVEHDAQRVDPTVSLAAGNVHQVICVGVAKARRVRAATGCRGTDEPATVFGYECL